MAALGRSNGLSDGDQNQNGTNEEIRNLGLVHKDLLEEEVKEEDPDQVWVKEENQDPDVSDLNYYKILVKEENQDPELTDQDQELSQNTNGVKEERTDPYFPDRGETRWRDQTEDPDLRSSDPSLQVSPGLDWF